MSAEWPKEKFSNFSSPEPGKNEYFFPFKIEKQTEAHSKFESASQGKNFEIESFIKRGTQFSPHRYLKLMNSNMNFFFSLKCIGFHRFHGAIAPLRVK